MNTKQLLTEIARRGHRVWLDALGAVRASTGLPADLVAALRGNSRDVQAALREEPTAGALPPWQAEGRRCPWRAPKDFDAGERNAHRIPLGWWLTG